MVIKIDPETVSCPTKLIGLVRFFGIVSSPSCHFWMNPFIPLHKTDDTTGINLPNVTDYFYRELLKTLTRSETD